MRLSWTAATRSIPGNKLFLSPEWRGSFPLTTLADTLFTSYQPDSPQTPNQRETRFRATHVPKNSYEAD